MAVRSLSDIFPSILKLNDLQPLQLLREILHNGGSRYHYRPSHRWVRSPRSHLREKDHGSECQFPEKAENHDGDVGRRVSHPLTPSSVRSCITLSTKNLIHIRYTTSLKVALTCATPEPHQVELPDKYRPEDWDKLMKEAKELINVNNTAFDETSLRQAIVKETLEESFAGRQIESLPLACKKNATDSSVSWSSVSTILGDLIDPKSSTSQNFELLYSQLCTKLVFQDPSNKDNNQISHAIIKDLVQGKERKIIARYYVICGGGIRNPQLLFSSGCEQSGSSERLPALVSGFYFISAR